MHNIRLRTPISYYGGKQKLASRIISFIPRRTLYCEPFIGGAAIFFAKRPSEIEVINDTNGELINFYRTVKEGFSALEAEISTSLHSRDLHRKASLIYNNPDMFDRVKRAWAVWILSTQSFAGILDGIWGFDLSKNTTTKKSIPNVTALPALLLKDCNAVSWNVPMHYMLSQVGIPKRASFTAIPLTLILIWAIMMITRRKIMKSC